MKRDKRDKAVKDYNDKAVIRNSYNRMLHCTDTARDNIDLSLRDFYETKKLTRTEKKPDPREERLKNLLTQAAKTIRQAHSLAFAMNERTEKQLQRAFNKATETIKGKE